jgi:membrane-associated phospholipid phosphatase
MSSLTAPEGTRHPARTAATLLAALVVLVLVVVGVGWLLTHPLVSSVGRWDDEVSRWFADRRTPGLSRVADVGTFLGETPVGAALILLWGAVVAAVVRAWRPLLFVVVMYAGMGVVYFAATHLVHRDRPPVRILDAGLVPDRSFPSGHVGTATAVALCLALLLHAYRLVPARWLVVLALVPLLTLLARLYQGAHHVSDVLTSLGYATTWALVCARGVLPGAAERQRLSPARGRGSAPR